MNTATSDRIIEAAITLFAQKGYTGVTTKEIAREAGVSEMTLFRHFASKRNLFERALERCVFSPQFRSLFEESLEGDMKKDLLKISSSYQELLQKNKSIILMQFINEDLASRSGSPPAVFPGELRRLLVGYFAKMKARGMVKRNPEVLATSFLAANFGFFMTFMANTAWSGSADLHSYISNFVDIFSKGMVT